MLSEILKIGKTLQETWQRDCFPDVARMTLENLTTECSLPDFELQITDWLRQTKLPEQLNLYNNFGEPSLTLFNNGKFAVDVYFWRNSDTIIHSHGFRGAFKILHGISLHEEFDMEVRESFSEDILKTHLVKKGVRIMKLGDVQQIDPGLELTHSVVHLENPTVSLCLRTVEDTDLHQWHHLGTGLSFQKKHISQKTIKQMLYFQYLLKTDFLQAQAMYSRLLSELDTTSQISLYEGLCLDQIGLDAETSEIATETLQDRFQATPWFEMYSRHFQELEKCLQENQAPNPELKLLAYGINHGMAKSQISDLLKDFSKKSLSSLYDELKNTSDMFTEGFEHLQMEKLNRFGKSADGL